MLKKYWYISLIFLFLYLDINLNKLASLSIDFADHYSLAFLIAKNGLFTLSTDPILGSMHDYPKLAHTLVAIFSIFTKSVIYSLQIITLLSIFLTWIIALYIVNSLSREGIIKVLLLIFFITLNYLLFNFDIYGFEIKDSFFFSQLFSELLFLILIAACISFRNRFISDYIISIMVFVFSIVLVEVHLIGAVQSIILLLIINAYDSMCIVFKRKKLNFYKFSINIVLFIAFVIYAFYFSHSFSVMSKISSNNGALSLNHFNNPLSLMLEGVFLIIISTFSLYRNQKNINKFNGTVYYLSLGSVSIASLCCLQYFLLMFGIGSEYAVKKYAFGLNTFVILQLISLIFISIEHKIWAINFEKKASLINFNYSKVLIIFFTVILLQFTFKQAVSTAKISENEFNLRAIGSLINGDPLKPNLVLSLNNLPSMISYMFNVSIFEVPRDISLEHLTSFSAADFEKIDKVIVGSNSKIFTKSGCALDITSGTIRAYNSKCLDAYFKNFDQCAGEKDFTESGYVNPRLLTGFSNPETIGRWSSGGRAQFKCLVKSSGVSEANICGRTFLAKNITSHHVDITINEHKKYSYTLRNPSECISIPLNQSDFYGKDYLVLDFNFPDAVSPKSLGLSEDGRMISFAISNIIFK